MPFIMAAIFAYLGDPVADWLETKKLSRTLSVTIVFIVMTLIVLAVVLMMIPMIGQQVELLSKNSLDESFLTETLMPWLLNNFGIEFDLKEMKTLVSEQLIQSKEQIIKVVTSSGMALFGWLGNLALIPVVTFYLLRDWDVLVKKIQDLLPRNDEPIISLLTKECDEVLSAFIRGQLMVMFILALVYMIGLSIVGLKLALLVGLIAGLASVVPYLGFIIGILVASIAGLMQTGDPMILLWIGIVFTIGQLLEGMVLTPLLVGDKIGLHPVAVIFAVLAGGQLFGFVGVLLALPVAAIIMVLLRHAHDRYLSSLLYGIQEDTSTPDKMTATHDKQT